MSLPRQLRDESDFDQLPSDIAISAHVADTEERKGFSNYYVFIIEVKTKGGSKYLIYRRYREFYALHASMQKKFGSGIKGGTYYCILPTLPGKVFVGNKQEIAEQRIPALNTYMKRLLCLPTWVLLDEELRMFYYQTEFDSQHFPKALRRLRPQTRKIKTLKPRSSTVDQAMVARAQALYDFPGDEEVELKFHTGDVITLLRRVNNDWLEGSIHNRTGIFPQAFVRIIQDLPAKGFNGEEEEEHGQFVSLLTCCFHGDDAMVTRDIVVEEDLTIQPTFQDLLSRMRREFKEEDIALNYLDPEGDMIRITDDQDVELMISECKGHGEGGQRAGRFFPWQLHITRRNNLTVYNTAPPARHHGN
ncbi:neutrophil cytosol factor 4 [Latimeria chalumnae]|uniref:Neutrophil cytosolic factor 4 n=1 Tax=Latimeria chalumnae TaxID=7897 RepID=H3A0Y9_LATCH|nr:PREDICTED: neutrophil cytosol factor 4 [Latimeria chalumnae]|eukprot:XP_006012165.1 PREDICTED: neutrophil cytosol factor 4 [Latimeria chalumnae]